MVCEVKGENFRLKSKECFRTHNLKTVELKEVLKEDTKQTCEFTEKLKLNFFFFFNDKLKWKMNFSRVESWL